jgi:hypothetical protein
MARKVVEKVVWWAISVEVLGFFVSGYWGLKGVVVAGKGMFTFFIERLLSGFCGN